MKQRTFMRHPDRLSEMLILRLQGWSTYALAKRYGVDKTTIEHWCEEFSIAPVVMTTTTVLVFRPNLEDIQPQGKVYKYQHLFDEDTVMPEQKSYARIRVEARKRVLIKLGVISQ